jgi:gluconolactonase
MTMSRFKNQTRAMLSGEASCRCPSHRAFHWMITCALGSVLIGAGLVVAESDRPVNIARAVIFSSGAKLESLYTRQARLNSGLTESPTATADGAIYFTDMPFGDDHGMILRFDPKSGRTTVFTSNSGKSNGLAVLPDGSLVSCDGADGGGRRLVKWNIATAQETTLVESWNGKKFNSPNDLCVDIKGRVYFTDPRYGGTEPRELDCEAVYRFDPDGSVREITREVEKPNGIVLSPDERTLYVADHNNGGNRLKPTDPEPRRGAMKVYAFPLDEHGLVAGVRQTLVDFGKENGCDGMTVDEAGNIYLACRSLARPGVMVITPDGRELDFLQTGPSHQSGLFDDWKGIPSNVEFGVGDDASSLYVTVDKGLSRIRTTARGFHPNLKGR